MHASIIIPVGPSEANTRWLKEAVDSCWQQTVPPTEVLIIDDGSYRKWGSIRSQRHQKHHEIYRITDGPYVGCSVWFAPWRMGVGGAFNAGVALAENEHVFMLGSDDWLEEDCIEKCLAKAQLEDDPIGYYWVQIIYSDDRQDKIQDLPCNAAMVSKTLWKHCGGFPVETASGAPDAALISIMLAHEAAGHLHPVCSRPLYNYRVHNGTDTAKRQPWQGVILDTRRLLTEYWP